MGSQKAREEERRNGNGSKQSKAMDEAAGEVAAEKKVVAVDVGTMGRRIMGSQKATTTQREGTSLLRQDSVVPLLVEFASPLSRLTWSPKPSPPSSHISPSSTLPPSSSPSSYSSPPPSPLRPPCE